MFCGNCGRENRQGDSFCIGCGVSLGTNVNNVIKNVAVDNQQVNNNVNSNDVVMNIVKWFFRISGIIFCICVFVVIGSLFYVTNVEYEYPYIEAQQNHYVYFDDFKIPTIYKLIQEYDMCREPETLTYTDRDATEYYYCDDYMDIDVLKEYSELLIRDYGYVKDESKDDCIVLVNSSLEEKHNIQVTIFFYRESVEYASIRKVNLKEEDNSL